MLEKDEIAELLQLYLNDKGHDLRSRSAFNVSSGGPARVLLFT